MVQQDGSPYLQPDDAKLVGYLKHELMRLQRASPEEALKLGPRPSKSEIRAAFLRDTKRFHPNRFARRDRQVTRLANEVFLLIKDAYYDLAGARQTPVRGAAPVAAKRTSPVALTQNAAARRATGSAPASRPEMTGRARQGGQGGRPGRARASTARPTGQASRPAHGSAGQRPAGGSSQRPVRGPSTAGDASRRPANRREQPANPSGRQNPPGRLPPIKPSTPRVTSGPGSALARKNRRASTQGGAGRQPAPPGAGTRRPAAKPRNPTRNPTRNPARNPTRNPGDAQVAEGLVQALQFADQRKWPEAMHVLQVLFKSHPRDRRIQAYAHYIRGREYESVGNTASARTEYERVLSIDPTLEAAQRALSQLGGRGSPPKKR